MRFTDKESPPEEYELSHALGEAITIWKDIVGYVRETYSPVREEWKFYGKKHGWQLKVLLKKRNLFFLVPLEGYFRMGLVFGDRAVEKIKDSGIHPDMIKTITEAKKYAEGRGLPVDIKSDFDGLEDIKTLIRIKVEN